MRPIDVSTRVWTRLLDLRTEGGSEGAPEWTEAEKAAFDLYAPLASRNGGYVTVAQIGQSLDGRIATVTGDARDVSGPDGLAHLHRMRALVDAVVIGVRTALHDLPRMTVRLCEGPNPARVVIDPKGRLPDDAPLLQSQEVRRIVVQAVDRPRPNGVEVIRLPDQNGALCARAILAALHDANLQTIMVEGGGITIANFLDAGLLERLHVAIAPLLIGGGPQSLTLPNPVRRLSDAMRPDAQIYGLGSDIVFDCDLRA
ncbi:RibD family protein [Roseovarius aestuariivivens]|uniref:RibD family protein n=1 Tax=Roseovarius aestuariivivens TaxID=1888910 RepID=UPI001082011B|nr:RibD family protein [Roseovarius aestuariivivens]